MYFTGPRTRTCCDTASYPLLINEKIANDQYFPLGTAALSNYEGFNWPFKYNLLWGGGVGGGNYNARAAEVFNLPQMTERNLIDYNYTYALIGENCYRLFDAFVEL